MNRPIILFCTFVTGSLAGLVWAQDNSEKDARIEALREYLEQSVEWYQFMQVDGEEPLEPRIVLRWDNQVRGAGSAVGVTVVWANDTRPQAIGAIFPWSGLIMHECDLLAREPNLIGKREGRVVWQPKEAGIKFQPVPNAPPPAASKTRRRLQLKQLASQFEATMLGWKSDNSDRQELRMLPQWLDRYGRQGADCLDGAIFGYVMGTDPEAVLLIEAFRTGEDAYRWEYAFARRTSGALEARLDGEVVWTAEKFPVDIDPSLPHLTLREPLPAGLAESE